MNSFHERGAVLRSIGCILRFQKGLINSVLEGHGKLHRGNDIEFRMKMSLSDREGKEGENILSSLSRAFKFISRLLF